MTVREGGQKRLSAVTVTLREYHCRGGRVEPCRDQITASCWSQSLSWATCSSFEAGQGGFDLWLVAPRNGLVLVFIALDVEHNGLSGITSY